MSRLFAPDMAAADLEGTIDVALSDDGFAVTGQPVKGTTVSVHRAIAGLATGLSFSPAAAAVCWSTRQSNDTKSTRLRFKPPDCPSIFTVRLPSASQPRLLGPLFRRRAWRCIRSKDRKHLTAGGGRTWRRDRGALARTRRLPHHEPAETPGMVGRLEPAHALPAAPRVAVASVGTVVQSPALAVFDSRCEFGFRGRAGGELVGHQDARHAPAPETHAEQALCGYFSAPLLNEGFEECVMRSSMLANAGPAHRAPQPMGLAVHPDDDLVEMPFVRGNG